MSRYYAYRDGKVVEVGGPDETRRQAPVPGGGDPRGMSFQFPRWYKHAKNFTPDGRVIWTTKREAQEIAKRAEGEGDGSVSFDR